VARLVQMLVELHTMALAGRRLAVLMAIQAAEPGQVRRASLPQS
jgi:hypothetical protein